MAAVTRPEGDSRPTTTRAGSPRGGPPGAAALFRRRSVAGALVLLAAVTVAASWLLVDARRDARAATVDAATDLARAGATAVDTWLRIEAVRLATVAQVQLRGQVTDADLSEALEPLDRPFALVLDPRTPAMIAAHPPRPLDAAELLATFAHLRQASAGEVGAVPIETDTGRSSVAIAVPYTDDEGRPRILSSVGYVDDEFLPDDEVGLTSQFAALAGLDEAHVELRDPDGGTVLSPPDSTAPVGPVVTAPTATGHLVVATVHGADETGLPLPLQLAIVATVAGIVALAVVLVGRAAAAAEDARAEAAALARTRADYVAIVSHEVRTPLMVVTGMLSTALDDDTLDPGTRDQLLRRARAAAVRLDRVTKDVMTSALAERGRVEPVLQRVPLDRLLEDAVATSRLRSSEQLEVTCPPGAVAWTDPGLAARVVANLLDNAAKYGAAPYVLRAALDETQDVVVVEVVDHGTGFGEAEQVFDAYRQDATGSDRRAGGIGLGLHLATVIASALDGRLEHERVDGATVFRLSVPAVTPAEGIAAHDHPGRGRPG